MGTTASASGGQGFAECRVIDIDLQASKTTEGSGPAPGRWAPGAAGESQTTAMRKREINSALDKVDERLKASRHPPRAKPIISDDSDHDEQPASSR